MSKSNVWTTFWKQGFPTSFASQFPDNYTGTLAKFWEDQFASLNNAKVLDVATGNGAIALIAAKTAQEKSNNLDISAADFADIQPTENSNNPKLKDLYKKIRFYPCTPIEELPFPDKTFNLITSQFGFEYADRARSIKQIARTLVKGGKFLAICHHERSTIHKSCLEDRDAYMKGVTKLGIDKKLIELAKLLFEVASAAQARDIVNKQPIRRLIETLKADLLDLSKAFPRATTSIYLNGAARYLFGSFLTSSDEQKAKIISALSDELHASQSRIEQQIHATLSDREVGICEDLFLSEGLKKVRSNFLVDKSGDNIGWIFEFHKPNC
ncbi:class I SAM-dependent methyltransferase [Microbulbifer hainanensis]|uniref:class I SAM-dependent methyltransferase n=1 Tax=Microbulbifer hainanensis TaxID=2735675 RepID=UPI001867103E|nr:class I SAM-dependent methyltransferase [Microbulbifer hainanensis]